MTRVSPPPRYKYKTDRPRIKVTRAKGSMFCHQQDQQTRHAASPQRTSACSDAQLKPLGIE